MAYVAGDFEGLTRCLGALSGLALKRGDPDLAARLIGTAAAVRDRFGLQPWPWVPQAEQPSIERAAALLPGGEYAAQLAAAVRHYRNLSHFEGLTRCLGALSGLALKRGDPDLAARLIGTAAAVRDRFGLQPWPWVPQAEQPSIERAAALLPGGEYAAQLAAGRSQTIDEALTAALPIPENRQLAAT